MQDGFLAVHMHTFLALYFALKLSYKHGCIQVRRGMEIVHLHQCEQGFSQYWMSICY